MKCFSWRAPPLPHCVLDPQRIVEKKNSPAFTGLRPTSESSTTISHFFQRVSKDSLCRWNRQMNLHYWSVMSRFTLTCLGLEEISLWVPYPAASHSWAITIFFFFRILFLSPESPPLKQFLSYSLLSLKSVNWSNYLECSRKKNLRNSSAWVI